MTTRHDPHPAPEPAEPTDERAAERSADAYRAAFRRYAPVGWDVIERAQGDLLRLLVGKAPADVGAPAILAVSVLFGDHPKAEQAGYALVGTTLDELAPGRANTVLATLADGWLTASRAPLDRRATIIRQDLTRTLARLQVADLTPPERQAVAFLQDLLAGADAGAYA